MKNLLAMLVAVLVLCVYTAETDAGVKIRGISSVSRITPKVIPMLSKLPKLDESRLPADQTDGHITRQELFDIPEEEFEKLAEQPPPAWDGKGILTIDRGLQLQQLPGKGVRTTMNAILGVNFEGNLQGAFRPGDPISAVGPNHVVSTTNNSIRIYTKTGSPIGTYSTGVFLLNTQYIDSYFTDPKVVYDLLSGRFIIVWDYYAANPPQYVVAVSQSSDATAGWYVYQFDISMDGPTPTKNWADFPGLGYDNNCIYMTGNMYDTASHFQYVKTRIVDKNLMYTGQPLGWTDIVDLPGPGNHFTVKPAQSLSPTDTEYLVVHPNGGGGVLQMYSITGGPLNPVMENIGNLPVSNYGVPPGGTQLDCPQTTVDAGDARTQDPVWRDGYLHLANQGGVTLNGSPVCALQYYKVQTSPLTLLVNETYAAPGAFYLYPAVTVDARGTAFFALSRMSASEYASGAYTVRRQTDTSIEPSAILRAGLTAYWCGQTGHRWGDYESASIDPSDTTDARSSAWVIGNYAKGPSTWGSWIGKISLNFHQISGIVYDDCDSNSSTSGDRKPLPGLGVKLLLDTVLLASTVTDSTGSYAFPHLDDGTYDVVITLPGGDFALGAIAGSGGTSQTVVNDTDIQVTVSNADIASQFSVQNNFLVVVPHPLPTASNLVPDTYSSGEPGFTLTVHGTGFEPCGTVQLDGNDRATTYIDPTTLHAAILASDIASVGLHTVTVFNPSPGGGTSNGLTFTVHAPAPVFSAAPSSVSFGNDYVGTPLTDTVTVTNTGTADLTVSSVQSDSAQFSVVPASATLARQTSVPFLVTYLPTRMGPADGHIIFTHDAATSPDTLAVSGAGVDSAMFMTGSYWDWASAVDAKGKHKSYPRKADKVFFQLNMTAPANSTLTSSLVMTFNMAISSLTLYTSPAETDTIPYTSRIVDPKLKIWTYTFAPLLAGHLPIRIEGIGAAGKKIGMSYIWYSTGKASKQKGKAGDSLLTISKNVTGLPEPNLVNVGEEIFLKGQSVVAPYLGASNPLIVGTPFGLKNGRTVRMKSFGDILKSLVDTRSSLLHTQPPSCLLSSSQVTSLPPAKTNNSFFAQILTFKLNIAASATGKFPAGFGELTYFDSSNFFNIFNGRMLKSVLPAFDSMISCDDNYIVDTAKAMTFLRQVNGAFSDGRNQKDTFSFLQRTVVKGVKHIGEVPFLHRTPGIVPVNVPSPIVTSAEVPERYQLFQNYPNPFNPTTMIRFALPERSIVVLKVYNVLGQEVTSLIHNQVMDEGTQQVEFNASAISSGVYFYRLQVFALTGSQDNPESERGSLRFADTKKMILMR